MNDFDFAAPTTVAETLALLGAHAQPIAGGTDLLALLKNDVLAPRMLIDLQSVPQLNGITQSDDALMIGACTSMSDLLAWPRLHTDYALLAQACAQVAWPEIRALGTVGGNLCQRPRCWYFRHPLGTRCLKRGGDRCYPVDGRADGPFAIFGGGPCYAVHPSDLAPALVAMDAEVRIASQTGERMLPLADFFSDDDVRRENILRAGELLVAVRVPKPAAHTRAIYLKSKRRPSHDFARASVALSAVMRGGQYAQVRVMLGGVALRPRRLRAVETLLESAPWDEMLAARAGELAVQDARPLVSSHGTSNAVKIPLTRALVQRAIRTLMTQESAE